MATELRLVYSNRTEELLTELAARVRAQQAREGPLVPVRLVVPNGSVEGYVRLGIARDYWFSGLDAEVERITDIALMRLKDAGAELIETQLPGIARLIDLTTDQVQNHDVSGALARYLKEYGSGVTFAELIERASPDIQAVFKSYVLPGGANVVSEREYAAARDQYLPELHQLYQDYFSRTGVAAMVFPASSPVARPLLKPAP